MPNMGNGTNPERTGCQSRATVTWRTSRQISDLARCEVIRRIRLPKLPEPIRHLSRRRADRCVASAARLSARSHDTSG
jgi:hypothetical protein